MSNEIRISQTALAVWIVRLFPEATKNKQKQKQKKNKSVNLFHNDTYELDSTVIFWSVLILATPVVITYSLW